MKTLRTGPALVLLLLGGSPAAGAEELGGGVTLHGFVSQGWLKTTDNDLFFAETTRGTFEQNEAALSFSVEPSPHLRIGAQLFAANVGSEGNHRVLLDWAAGDYRHRDWLGLRAGRLKLPLGLYGSLRDADIGRPEIVQPEAVYTSLLQDVSRSFDGGALYGGFKAGAAGYVDYELFGGAVDVDDTAVSRRLSRDALQPLVAALSLSGLRGASGTVLSADGTNHHVYGARLEWRPPVEGLRLQATGMRHRSEIVSRSNVNGFQGPLPIALALDLDQQLEHDYWIVASAEYQRGGLRVTFEQTWQKVVVALAVQGLPTGPIAPTDQVSRPGGWYLQAAQRVGDKLQLSGYYSAYYNERTDKEGALLVLRGQPAFQRWDKDLAFTARVDFTDHVLLKAEFHDIDGAERLSASENPQGLTRDWQQFAAKLTFAF